MASNSISIIIQAKDNASKVIESVSNEIDGVSGSGSRLQSSLSRANDQIMRATKLLAVAGAAAVGTGIAFGIDFNNSVEQAQTKLMAFMGDSERVAKTLDWVKREAAAAQFSFTDMANAAANLTPVSKSTGVALEDLVKQAEILAALNPAEGLNGAVFSLRESLSGDWVSIIDRFNLPRQRINQLKAEGVPAMEIISRTLGEMGINYDLVAKQGQTVSARFDQLKDRLQMLAGQATKPIFDRIGQALDQLSDQDYDSIGNNLANIVSGALDVMSAAVKVVSNAITVFKAWSPLILGVAAGFVAYKVAILTANAASVTSAAVMQLLGYRYVMLNGALTTMRVATVGQTVAQVALNAAMSINPIGLVVGAAAALTAGLWLLSNATGSTSSSTERLNEARRLQAERAELAKQKEQELADAQLRADQSALAAERAQTAYNQAVDRYGAESLEAREAALQLRQSHNDLQQSTQALTDKQNSQLVSLQLINGELTKLNGRSINYSVNGHQVAEWEQGGKRYFGGAFASGTNNAPGGTALVGEHGPELVRLPQGSQVDPAWRTRSGSGLPSSGGHTVVIENYNSYNERDDQRFFRDVGFALELAS